MDSISMKQWRNASPAAPKSRGGLGALTSVLSRKRDNCHSRKSVSMGLHVESKPMHGACCEQPLSTAVGSQQALSMLS
jgi:hypothetical protein